MSGETGPTFHWPEGRQAAVSLSFDDARLSQVDLGLGVLDACGVKATFYVSIGNLRQRLDGWRAAAAAGHEIGNHTLTHPCSGNFPFARGKALEDYTLDGMEAELLGANDEIRRLLGVVPRTFAYPCGQTYVGRGPGVQSYVPLVARHFLVGRAAFNETHNDPGFCDLAQAFSLDGDGKSFR
jgi:peptidoglycan/xylan/chitin deacetylase (PgdA/CDA1 family)